MVIKKPKSADISPESTLRQRAEAQTSRHDTTASSLHEADIKRLIHELQVHQIELEMQNEELRQAHDEVAAGMERYSDLYDFAPVGYFTLDRAGRVKQANLSGASLLGVNRAHLAQRPFRFFVLEDERPLFNAFLENVFTSQTQNTCDMVLVNASSTPLWVKIKANVSNDGEQCRLMVHDVSERKLAEDELLRQDARLRQAQSMARLGFWEWDVATDTTIWSDEMLSIYGISREEFTGRGEDYLNFTHPDDRHIQRENIRKDFERAGALARETGDLMDVRPDFKEFRIVRKNGSICWVRGDAVEVVDEQGKALRMHGILWDITEQKLAEEQIRLSEERYRLISELSTDFVYSYWFKTEDQPLVEWQSGNISQLTGYDPEFLNKNYATIIHPEDRPTHQEHSRKMWAGQISSIEYRIITHSGVTLWISDSLHPIWDESLGRVVRVYGSLKDISERKRAEEILKTRLRLVDFAAGHSLEELIPAVVNEIENLTASRIGFFHFVENDQPLIARQQWSARTRSEHPGLNDPAANQRLGQAGMWEDVLLERRPIIHNDFKPQPGRKMPPENHPILARELVFPILRAGKIVAIVGIGNKAKDYDRHDLEIVSQISDLAWDIIERKRTEQRLHDEQFFSQATIDALTDHLCVLDEEGVILNVNRAWRMFADANPPVIPGYCLGMNYLAVCDQAQGEQAIEAAAFAQGLRAVIQGRREHFSLVYPCHRPSGEERWFNARVSRFELSGVVRTVVVHESITEIIRVSKQTHLLTTAMEQSPASIIITDPHGQIEYANPKFCELTGYTLTEVIGKNPRILKSGYTPADEYTQLWQTIHSGQTWQGEFHNRKKNGDLYWEQAVISPVLDPDSRIGHFLAVKEDITQRKMAEEALRESEARFRTLIEQSPAAIGVSRAGKTVYANPPFLHMFGFDALAEIQGRPILEQLAPQSHEKIIQYAMRRESGDSLEMEFDAVGLRKDGTEFPFHLAVNRMQLDDGPALVGFFSDITLQKQAEAENQRLFDQIRSRAEELENLARLSSVLRQARLLAEIVPLLITETIAALHADSGMVFLPAQDDLSQTSGRQFSQPDDDWQAVFNAFPQQVSAAPAFYYSAPDDPAVSGPSGLAFQSFGFVQLKSTEVQLGMLCVGYRERHAFSDEEKRLLVAIAEMAGNAIQRVLVMETLERRVQVRTRDLAALYEIASLAGAMVDLQLVMAKSLEKSLEIVHSTVGLLQIFSVDHENLEMSVYSHISTQWLDKNPSLPLQNSLWSRVVAEKQSAFIPIGNPEEDTFMGEFLKNANSGLLCAPVSAQGLVMGVIGIFCERMDAISHEEIALLETIAGQIGTAVAGDRLRRLSKESAILQERQRLARDLHDSVTQSLYSLNLLAEGYRKQAARANPAELDGWFAELGDSAHQAIKDMRLLLYELRPNAIQQDGLAVAIHRRLEAVEGRSGMKSRFTSEGDLQRLNHMQEEELYHIVQEALNNALKHAFAKQMDVKLAVNESRIHLSIEDDSAGFDVNGPRSEGMGLTSMKQRAEKLGGSLEIISQPGKGTRIQFIREEKNE